MEAQPSSHCLFTIDGGEKVDIDLPWYRVLDRQPLAGMIIPALLVSLLFLAGAVAVGVRLVRRQSVAPGEFLWLLVGVQQAIHIPCFMIFYRYEVLPTLWRESHSWALWFLPRVGGAAVMWLMFFHFRSDRVWRRLLCCFAILWSVVAFDAYFPHQGWWDEESLATIGDPIASASTALGMAIMTWRHGPNLHSRTRFHWLGLLAMCIPLLWCLGWCALGWAVFPREFLWRTYIRE